MTVREIRIVDGEVARLVVDDDRLSGVEFADGRLVPRAAVFVGPGFVPRDELLTRISTQLVQGKGLPRDGGVGSGMDDHGEGVARWSSGSVALEGSFGATHDHRLGRSSRGQRG